MCIIYEHNIKIKHSRKFWAQSGLQFSAFLAWKKNLSLLGMCPLYILLLALLPQLALGEFLQDLIVALWKYNCTILPHFTVYHSFSSKLKEKKVVCKNFLTTCSCTAVLLLLSLNFW